MQRPCGWKHHSTFEELKEGQRVKRMWGQMGEDDVRGGEFAQGFTAMLGGLVFLKGNGMSLECLKKSCGSIGLHSACREGADRRG